jgi:hypothetical protein
LVYGSELKEFSVETPGGRIHISWDFGASATPNAQLAFVVEFLAYAGVYKSWVDSCPLSYGSSQIAHAKFIESSINGRQLYSAATGAYVVTVVWGCRYLTAAKERIIIRSTIAVSNLTLFSVYARISQHDGSLIDNLLFPDLI